MFHGGAVVDSRPGRPGWAGCHCENPGLRLCCAERRRQTKIVGRERFQGLLLRREADAIVSAVAPRGWLSVAARIRVLAR